MKEGEIVFWAAAIKDEKMYYIPVEDNRLFYYDLISMKKKKVGELPKTSAGYMHLIINKNNVYAFPYLRKDDITIFSLEEGQVTFQYKIPCGETYTNLMNFAKPIICESKMWVKIQNEDNFLKIDLDNKNCEIKKVEGEDQFDLSKKIIPYVESDKIYLLDVTFMKKQLWIENMNQPICINNKKYIVGYDGLLSTNNTIYVLNKMFEKTEKMHLKLLDEFCGRYDISQIINGHILCMISFDGKTVIKLDLSSKEVKIEKIALNLQSSFDRFYLKATNETESLLIGLSDKEKGNMIVCNEATSYVIERPVNDLNGFIYSII